MIDAETKTIAIRDATPADFESICALNLAAVEQTSSMDPRRLAELHALSWYHKLGLVDGSVAAFLLAMHSDAPYQNENFAWFTSRHARFIYVDRVVVSAQHRGLRLGTLLYEDLFRRVRAAAIPLVTCEYNLVPPNEPSQAFHAKFGFTEQGRQWLAGGTKQVSMQAATL